MFDGPALCHHNPLTSVILGLNKAIENISRLSDELLADTVSISFIFVSFLTQYDTPLPFHIQRYLGHIEAHQIEM